MSQGDHALSDATPDAIVIGSGPNGLAAAITLARAGRSVVVHEAADEIGGGMRSAALTLPGFTHDICSTIQGTSLASPFFRDLDLARHGLELVHPDVPLAHVFDDGSAALLQRSVRATAAGLGAAALGTRMAGQALKSAGRRRSMRSARAMRRKRRPR